MTNGFENMWVTLVALGQFVLYKLKTIVRLYFHQFIHKLVRTKKYKGKYYCID